MRRISTPTWSSSGRFPAVYNVGDMLEGYSRAYSLADAPEMVVPGHDPQVLQRFSAGSKEHEGWIVRLDAPAH